jgi:HSP20 family molecular chaperone IbpA
MRKADVNGLKKRNPYSKRPVDIIENLREYLIRIHIPECDDEDVSLKVSGHLLYISVRNEYLHTRDDHEVYSRYFKLPANSNMQKIRFWLDHDILNIKIPKTQIKFIGTRHDQRRRKGNTLETAHI